MENGIMKVKSTGNGLSFKNKIVRQGKGESQELIKLRKAKRVETLRKKLYKPSNQILRQRGLSTNKSCKEKETVSKKEDSEMKNKKLESVSTRIASKINTSLIDNFNTEAFSKPDNPNFKEEQIKIEEITSFPKESEISTGIIIIEDNRINLNSFNEVPLCGLEFDHLESIKNQTRYDVNAPLQSISDYNRESNLNAIDFREQLEFKRKKSENQDPEFKRQEEHNRTISFNVSRYEGTVKDDTLDLIPNFDYTLLEERDNILPDYFKDEGLRYTETEDRRSEKTLTNQHKASDEFLITETNSKLSASNSFKKNLDWNKLISLNYNFKGSSYDQDCYRKKDFVETQDITQEQNPSFKNTSNSCMNKLRNLLKAKENSIGMFNQKPIKHSESDFFLKSTTQSKRKDIEFHPFNQFESSEDEIDSFYEKCMNEAEEGEYTEKVTLRSGDSQHEHTEQEEDEIPSQIYSEQIIDHGKRIRKSSYSDVQGYNEKFIIDNYMATISETQSNNVAIDNGISKVKVSTNTNDISSNFLNSTLKSRTHKDNLTLEENTVHQPYYNSLQNI